MMDEIPEDIRRTVARMLEYGEQDRMFSAVACAILDERERAANVAYRVCAETRHVTLGEAAAAAIRSGARP